VEDNVHSPSGGLPGHLVEEAVRGYIELLTSSYIVARRRTRRDFFMRPRYDDPAWRRCAEALLAAKLNPTTYVQFVFSLVVPVRGDMYETDVTSQQHVGLYRTSHKEHEQESILHLKLQLNKVKMLLASGETIIALLQDPNNELTPLTRYALAWSEGLYEHAKRFEAAAREEALFEPARVGMLKSWLPEDF